MKNIQITKFEFPDLASTHNPQETAAPIDVEVIDQGEKLVMQEHVDETYVDHNIMSEVGQDLKSDITPIIANPVKITQDEIDSLVAQAQRDAVEQYIALQKTEDDNIATENSQIISMLTDIKERFEVESQNLLENILKLAYAIAAKMVDIELISLSEERFINIIKKRIKSLNFKEGVTLEVKDERLKNLFAQVGIAVSVNNDMLTSDYKIMWCNGFLDRNTADIASQIERILIDQIQK